MKQLLAYITIATTIASSTLAGHSAPVATTLLDLYPQKIEKAVSIVPQKCFQVSQPKSKSSVFIGSNTKKAGDLIAIQPQPLPPGRG